MKYIVGILVVVASIILLGCMGAITDGVKDYRTDWVTDEYVLTTNASTTSGVVHLSNPLWEGLTTEAVLASNSTSDTPAMTGYTAASRNLAFDGLATNTSRLISVDYRTFALNNYPAADTGTKFIPGILILVIVLLPLITFIFVLTGR